MSTSSNLAVLKFGGSVLGDARSIPFAVTEVKRHLEHHDRLVVVVSAFKNHTDTLETAALALCAQPTPETLAFYMGLGELRTTGELTLGLQAAGIGATLRMPWDVWFLSSGAPLEASPVAVSRHRFLDAFKDHRVVVFPGFIGRSQDGRPQLLGRGGSDLTAIFLAAELGAERCILLKDAPGLYEWDPAPVGPRPRRYVKLTWNDAIALDARMLKPAHADYARSRAVTIEVMAPGVPGSTIVGSDVSEFAPPDESEQTQRGTRE
jgi:homoserine dehydrogenase